MKNPKNDNALINTGKKTCIYRVRIRRKCLYNVVLFKEFMIRLAITRTGCDAKLLQITKGLVVIYFVKGDLLFPSHQ